MAEDQERIKLRRWALETLLPASSIETSADVAHLCLVADQLIEFVMTGRHPSASEPNWREQVTEGPPPSQH